MKDRRAKSFPAGENRLFLIAEFVSDSVDEIGREKTIRVSIETVATGLIVDEVIGELGLDAASPSVREFVSYRAEIRKPIRSVEALSRLLKKFRDRPDWLEEAVRESVSNGWTGLFPPKDGRASQKADRSFRSEGGSLGGEW